MTQPNRCKVLASLLLSIAIATSASAAELAIRFAGPNALDEQVAFVPSGESVLIEVIWTTTAQETLANPLDLVVLDLTSQWEDPNPGTQGDAIENPYLTISNFSTDVPGWITDGEPGTVGGTSFFAAGAGVAGDSIDTAGTTVLGTFEVTALDPPDFYPLDIYIRRNPNGPLPGGSWPALWGLEGGFYTFDPDADGISNTFSIGTGFAGNDDGSNFSPLTIYVPEPTALLLLATGVLVAIRRNPR